MLRITELRLPLTHAESDLRESLLERLQLAPSALRSFHIFRRGYDARKKSAIELVYTVDCDVGDAQEEARVLQRLVREIGRAHV